MTDFKIEKNVPLPEDRPAATKYPFGQMEVGDSFAVDPSQATRVRNAACYHARNHGAKFSILKNGEKFRCWRIA